MAANNDLDDFFKKKDRKVNKSKKQTGLLTNNEELLKQLVIVTSATSAFKENMDFDEEDEELAMNDHNRQHLITESNGITNINEVNYPVMNKSHSNSTTTNSKSKNTTKLSVQDNNNLNEQQTGVGQQDEWEEFEDSNSKYQQIRLKISRGTNEQNIGDEDEDNDDYYDDGHNHDGNTDENYVGNDGEQRGNRRREQQKDKPAWKLDQVKPTEPLPTTNDTTDSPSEKTEEPVAPPKPAATAYRAPALRNNSSVTVVGHVNQKTSKKEKPNLASTEEFPTLGATVNKK